VSKELKQGMGGWGGTESEGGRVLGWLIWVQTGGVESEGVAWGCSG